MKKKNQVYKKVLNFIIIMETHIKITTRYSYTLNTLK